MSTQRTDEVKPTLEEILEILPHLILGNAEALYNDPDGQLAKDTISEMQRVVREANQREVKKSVEEALHAVDVLCESGAEYPNGVADGAWVYLGKIKSILRTLTNKES